jgi:hypothetical protein
MNSSEYRKAYMANLKLEVSNNDKNLQANKTQLSTNQYIQNTGQQVLGVSTFSNTNSNTKKHKK